MIIPERHLGYTRFGKKICAYDTKDPEYIHEQLKEFDASDNFDAFCLFQFMWIKAVRQYGEFSDEAEKMEFMSECHQRCVSEECITKEKQSLALITSIDIRNHGESLVQHILRESISIFFDKRIEY